MKKGQGSMEFLQTYGWALLVVLVAIGGLAWFGVIDPESFFPSVNASEETTVDETCYKEQVNVSITIDQELIDKIADPPNFIQPYHEHIDWFVDKQNKQLIVNDVIECSSGQGLSMQPTFFPGNIVCYKEFKGTTVNIGDLIMYDNDHGGLSVHRVRAVYDSDRGKRIYVQGDGLTQDNLEIISINDIKAKVVGVLYE